jgi:hypothetical protein
MKALLWFAVFCLSAVAFGQVVANPIVCTTNVTVAPILRFEGITELVGDIVLQCAGGTPTPAGQVVPPVDITFGSSLPITSRQFSNGASVTLATK